MFLAAAVFHLPMSWSWLKAAAPLNMAFLFVTAAVFHAPMSATSRLNWL
jgi:hypothetical protein